MKHTLACLEKIVVSGGFKRDGDIECLSHTGEYCHNQSDPEDHECQVRDDGCHVEPERPLGTAPCLHVLPSQLSSP